jgi:hypothetical protein
MGTKWGQRPQVSINYKVTGAVPFYYSLILRACFSVPSMDTKIESA